MMICSLLMVLWGGVAVAATPEGPVYAKQAQAKAAAHICQCSCGEKFPAGKMDVGADLSAKDAPQQDENEAKLYLLWRMAMMQNTGIFCSCFDQMYHDWIAGQGNVFYDDWGWLPFVPLVYEPPVSSPPSAVTPSVLCYADGEGHKYLVFLNPSGVQSSKKNAAAPTKDPGSAIGSVKTGEAQQSTDGSATEKTTIQQEAVPENTK